MSQAKTKNSIKRLVDAAMTVLLLLLMAYQVTGEALHEWIGIGMTGLVILHQILNFHFLMLAQRPQDYSNILADISVNLLPSVLRRKYDMVFASPTRM